MLAKSLFRQSALLFKRPLPTYNSLGFTSTVRFSEFFRERDKAEFLVYEDLDMMDKRYRKIKDGWEKPLARKQAKRERVALVKANETLPEPEPEKLVVHDQTQGITLPAKDEGIFAVIQVGGSQVKVVKDDVVVTEQLKDYDLNDQIVFERVFLIGTKDYTSLGRPYVESAKVYATVEEQTMSEKVIVFKKKRRKNYKRTNGSQQPLTVLRIDKIEHNVTPEILERAVNLI